MERYKILSGLDNSSDAKATRKLEAKVNEAIEDGYEPLGGPMILPFQNQIYGGLHQVSQAVYMRRKDTKPYTGPK